LPLKDVGVIDETDREPVNRILVELYSVREEKKRHLAFELVLEE
jgi:hypothetical protein